MKKYNKLIGNYGEDICVKKLIEDGYKILSKNYRCKLGEIDIIAIHEETLCFIEIKSRFSNSYGIPSESVTYSKTRRIINAAKYYVLTNNYTDINVRFDIMEVTLNYKNNKYIINILKDSFRL